MSKKILLLLTTLLFASRLLFVNTQNIFFDSAEYTNLFSNSNYLLAIISGHPPPHEGYIILFWPIFQLAKFLNLNPVYSVIVGQILLSFLSVYCFYNIVKFLTDKKVALFSSIIVSLIPIFWITNVTVMMETTYLSFFLVSMYFLIQYIKNSKKLVYLHLSTLSLSLSFLTHTLVILWLPLYIAIVYYYKRNVLLKTIRFAIIYLIFALILNLLFISFIFSESINYAFKYLYLTKGGEFAYLNLDINSFLIAIRNFLIPLMRNNTYLIFILGILSLIMSFKTNKKIFTLGILWLFPAFYANQWWDSLLNGRHALIASFGLAFLAAYLIKKRTIFVCIVIIYLLIASVPTLNLLKKPIPYIQEAQFAKTLPSGSLLIETHFARPQVQDVKLLNFFFVNEPGFDKNNLSERINKYLENNKQVFISSGALSEPYGLYSGPYLHNITLSYTKHFELEPVIKNYTLKKYKIINAEDNLIIYEIVSKNPSNYPEVKNLRNSYRRLDYNDPLWRLSSRFIPQ